MPPALPPMLQEEKPKKPASAGRANPERIGVSRLILWGACAAWTFWTALSYQSKAYGQAAFFAAADACVWIAAGYVVCRAVDEAIFMEHRK